MARRRKRGLRGLGGQSPLNKAVNTCLAFEAADRKRGYNTSGTRIRAFNCVNEVLRAMPFEHGTTAPADAYKYGQIARAIESGMKAKGLVDDSATTKARRRRQGSRPHLNGPRKRRR